ncbi:MAG: hypothetical protein LQ350_001260 [Teloschistes chrysophthalmus]|nr:MAG: hypothetical protein LQ350_001260 [Niorma chrysophthalma]
MDVHAARAPTCDDVLILRADLDADPFIFLGAGSIAAAWYNFPDFFPFQTAFAEALPTPVEIKIEKTKKKKGLSKEENRDTISSQHLQVKRSWENPGVYAWGSNSGRVVAPDSDEQVIKTPRRIPYFDGALLRDIKLDRNFGAAITENGDLLQWGAGFSTETREPTVTLRGKNLKSLAISQDRVIALGSNGKVYSVSADKESQEKGAKVSESSWIPFLSFNSEISYRRIKPKSLGWIESVTEIACGAEHLLLLTSAGRLLTAAASSEGFPSRGQLGVPGLVWETRPEGPYDQLHEIPSLRGFNITAIAAGDYHSLALDREGRVHAFGDNSSGQLGFQPSNEITYVDAPSLVPMNSLYAGTGQTPTVKQIFAGGNNSFFTVDATNVARPGGDVKPALLGRITADTWSSGQGILGTLGNGRWTHIQGIPSKLKALSGLFEWNEINNSVVPIRLKSLSVGSTHAAAIMNNVTEVRAGTFGAIDSENDTNWGADVVWWGGNEYYQIGNGRRNNMNVPGYIAPLDSGAEVERVGKGKRREEHRFQITPKHRVDVGGRRVDVEQRVECGRMHRRGILSDKLKVIGFDPTQMSQDEFIKHIKSSVGESDEQADELKAFCERCSYISINQDAGDDSFVELRERMESFITNDETQNRHFYMALPPSIYVKVSEQLRKNCYSENGESQIIIEKPFGRDLETSVDLHKKLAPNWKETEIFRIDHYLGKEMVKNLMTLRFGNPMFGAVWDCNHIDNVQISMTEAIGTEGRGAYFDDTMQSELTRPITTDLMQLLALTTMERPGSFSAEDLRQEKARVLRLVPPLDLKHTVIGQFTKSADGKHAGYKDEDNVPADSKCATFCTSVAYVKNARWEGVPFILKSGKALNESKTEIRIQLKDTTSAMLAHTAHNQLIIRVQPSEAVRLKMNAKLPGLQLQTVGTELDLTYHQTVGEGKGEGNGGEGKADIPEAYETLLVDALGGDYSDSVSEGELEASWKVWTPLLEKLEDEGVEVREYAYGSEGPEGLEEFVKRYQYQREGEVREVI